MLEPSSPYLLEEGVTIDPNAGIFGHEYDPFLGTDFTIFYGGNVPGTAVVRIYTQDGFVVAADGLRRNHAGLEVTDKQQKVFGIEQRGGLFAYALTGITYIEDGPIPFSVSEAAGKIAKELLMEHFTSADRYVTRFGKLVNDALRRGQKDGRIKDFQDIDDQPGLIVRILFAGYFKAKAFMAEIIISHSRQKLQTPGLNFQGFLGVGKIEISGSPKVWDQLLNTENPDFLRYRSFCFEKVKMQLLLTEEEAVEVARSYIAACADPAGRALDRKCEGIGGHVHIATLKPQGFRWIIPPRSQGH